MRLQQIRPWLAVVKCRQAYPISKWDNERGGQ